MQRAECIVAQASIIARSIVRARSSSSWYITIMSCTTARSSIDEFWPSCAAVQAGVPPSMLARSRLPHQEHRGGRPHLLSLLCTLKISEAANLDGSFELDLNLAKFRNARFLATLAAERAASTFRDLDKGMRVRPAHTTRYPFAWQRVHN